MRRFNAGASLSLAAFAVGVSLAPPVRADGGGFKNTITSALAVDPVGETVTLPIFKGTSGGQTVWYVVTDSSNPDDARARGVNFAPKLANALGTAAVQTVTVVNGAVDFPGTVIFGLNRVVIPGPPGNEFGGGTYHEGAVGDARYSPLITSGDGIVVMASQVANATGQHNSLVSIDTVNRLAKLKSFFGFWNGHRTIYLHMEATAVAVAAAEASTLATNLDAAPGTGSNDVDTSARSAILPIVNGAVGALNPQRQGLNSALRGEGDPMNINQEVPGRSNRYSPVWDVTPVVWAPDQVAAAGQFLLTSHSAAGGAFSHGLVVSGGSGPANESLNGLQAAGFISNCPIVAVN